METFDEIIEGTCLTMCPEKELILREKERLLHPFEMSTGTTNDFRQGVQQRPVPDRSKMVKEFSRPAAGRADTEPDCLRPAPVLKETVEYLFTSIIPKSHPAWTMVYEFVFDRLRAVRQDMVIQGITGLDAINLLEQIVRFHLYSSYRLRDASIHDFDPVINKQHLLECLKRLLYLYQVTPGYHYNRVEMEAIYLLDNMGDNHALSHYLDLDRELRQSPLLLQCYSISMSFLQGNYLHALRLLWKLPCAMSLCAASRHLFLMRINFLEILTSGYSVKNCKFPVTQLTRLLHTASDKETLDLCSQCGLVDMFDSPDIDSVCFNKANLSKPKELKVVSQLCPLERLLQNMNVAQLLLGPEVNTNNSAVALESKMTQLTINENLGPRSTPITPIRYPIDSNLKKNSIGRGRGRGTPNRLANTS